MSGLSVGTHVLERSTYLVKWEVIATVQVNEPGPVAFEQPQLNGVPGVFYRIGLRK